ncbi:hypothetical protein H696_02462 [Fonticula alba]|uniref:Centromere protein H C-terminal domain-containing protein n=1 Tax=Fonticula alba TaxID=691883 RepID=A0A058ZAT0_FONAL|nr:hypothetical protein H696_02462 [Fonticula alba]KCV71525.1 hypothetical protein H696_02462 [Fonticula alba]|eukprot:XP_009494648.1 hypothetical protein H696_02462 [Fonticula alba]
MSSIPTDTALADIRLRACRLTERILSCPVGIPLARTAAFPAPLTTGTTTAFDAASLARPAGMPGHPGTSLSAESTALHHYADASEAVLIYSADEHAALVSRIRDLRIAAEARLRAADESVHIHPDDVGRIEIPGVGLVSVDPGTDDLDVWRARVEAAKSRYLSALALRHAADQQALAHSYGQLERTHPRLSVVAAYTRQWEAACQQHESLIQKVQERLVSIEREVLGLQLAYNKKVKFAAELERQNFLRRLERSSSAQTATRDGEQMPRSDTGNSQASAGLQKRLASNAILRNVLQLLVLESGVDWMAPEADEEFRRTVLSLDAVPAGLPFDGQLADW